MPLDLLLNLLEPHLWNGHIATGFTGLLWEVGKLMDMEKHFDRCGCSQKSPGSLVIRPPLPRSALSSG